MAPTAMLPSVPSTILHARGVDLRQVARLDAERLLRLRPVGGAPPAASSARRPGAVASASSCRSRRRDRAGWARERGSACCLTSARNSSSMSRSRTPCANASSPARSSPFASSRVKMCAVTRSPFLCASSMIGAVEIGRQLLVLAVAVVDPDLDEVDFPRGQLLHRLPRLGLGGHPVRRFGAPGSGIVIPRPAVRESRRVGNGLVPHLEATSPVSWPEAHRRRRRRSTPCAAGRSTSASRVVGRCVCVSTIAGITVLPARFTRVAPAGTGRRPPCRPGRSGRSRRRRRRSRSARRHRRR